MTPDRNRLRKSLLASATALCLAALSSPVLAQGATGAVAGRAEPGTLVTIRNPATGYSRSITVGADGNYRFTALPVGNYLISAPSGSQDVVVSLGTTTSANFSRDAVELAGIVVKAEPGFPVIDVSSTESATNITREELARLPVNQSVGSVALLAPGVNGGAAGFGGISFGGSSVAENAVYVNGLNVTDFYNRVGFSAAPFAFYQEFQVKTGGYSVEFGRTTGGIINAVSRSGSNDFHFGAEATLQPKEWESPARDRFDGSERYYTASQDTSSLYKINAWASGPIIRDRLFFFLMAEGRDARSDYTTNGGATMNRSRARNPFWGGKLDWNITGNHTVSLMGFTDESDDITSPYAWDFDTRTQGAAGEPVNSLTGGRNWNATYTGHFGDAFTARVMYGKAARNASTSSAADMECNTCLLYTSPSPRD